MTFPVQFRCFGNLYHLHYFFEVLAFFTGIRLYYYLRRQTADPISDTDRLWILLGAMFGALVGSRLVAILESPEDLKHLSFSLVYQSKTIVGGLLGGLLGVEIVKKMIGVTIASGDIYVIPIIVALFIGRIGCFSMGVDEPVYGVVTSFWAGMDLGDGQKRHPVMAYEMLFLLLLFLLFFCLRTKAMANGERFKLFMVLYFAFRFMVEFLKPYHALVLNLSSIHWSALLIFFYYYKFIIRTVKAISP